MQNSDNQDVAQLSRAAWIDQVADRFDAAWQSGVSSPDISEYLSGCSGDVRRELLRELVAVDREYRSKRGQSKSWQEYIAEFPELSDLEVTDISGGEETTEHRGLGASPHAASPSDQNAGRDFHSPPSGQPQAPPDPERIGKYHVLKRLGRGGQATAYLAFDPDLSKSVVIKLSHDAALAGEEDDLRGEGRVLAELTHPHLVRVLHYDLLDGRPYLVMEHIAGQNLAQWASGAAPPHKEVALLVAQIAMALALAHRRGIIHRDLKPANVLIDEQGQPRVIDFGLAWHRQGWDESDAGESVMAGTVAYIPPEQARGEFDRVGPRSDIFGLGGILYFLLTGHSLFQEPGERDFQRVLERARRCSFDVARLELSGASPVLQAICRRALAAEPEDRFATADDLATALLAWMKSGQATRRTALAAGAAALSALGLGLYGLSRTRFTPPPINPPILTLRVWRDGRLSSDWIGLVPLLSERDELQLEWNIPKSLLIDLFSINGQGELVPIAESIEAQGRSQTFPDAAGRSPLAGPVGTEAILLCCRPVGSKPPQLAWQTGEAWPAIQKGSVLRLTPQGTEVLQQGRDLGPARSGDSAVTLVSQRLKSLCDSLDGKYHYVEALVFAHENE